MVLSVGLPQAEQIRQKLKAAGLQTDLTRGDEDPLRDLGNRLCDFPTSRSAHPPHRAARLTQTLMEYRNERSKCTLRLRRTASCTYGRARCGRRLPLLGVSTAYRIGVRCGRRRVTHGSSSPASLAAIRGRLLRPCRVNKLPGAIPDRPSGRLGDQSLAGLTRVYVTSGLRRILRIDVQQSCVADLSA
jgi:hypothetical protein